MATAPLEVLAFRVNQNSAEIAVLKDWRDETAEKLAARDVSIDTISTELHALREDVGGIRKLLISLALSIAGSSVMLAISILVATGHKP